MGAPYDGQGGVCPLVDACIDLTTDYYSLKCLVSCHALQGSRAFTP